ncbi:MAG: HMP-PP phosphatase [Thiomicrorhabdus sp.]|nr:MAG: HMP-PP phosphatase [Thiomicrorhabdus sp.]
MLKLVVSDLDGTLLDPQHQLTPRTLTAVQSLVEQGVQFMIATGRHYQDVCLITEQLGVEVCLITSNGARIHNHLGELLYENQMPTYLVEKVIELSSDFTVHRNLYQQESWLVEAPNEALLAIHDATGFSYQLTNFSQIELSHIDKIYFTADHDILVELETVLKQHLSEDLYITFTSPEYLEVMNLGVSKGNALEMLLAQKGIERCDVMALGDGMNDREMLSMVGHQVVMDNACHKVKALFPNSPIAKANSQDGVADYLERHFSLLCSE